MNKQIEKEIEYLCFAMREPCGCKVCKDERVNIGENCVIRQALTQAHQAGRKAGIDEAVEKINKLQRWADTDSGEAGMRAEEYGGWLDRDEVLEALQDNK